MPTSKTLKTIEYIGFALIVIGFLILVTWALCFGIRKIEERKANGE